jgi:hypothetical protein
VLLERVRLVYLKIIFPGHISVNMSLRGTINGSDLALERRLGAIRIMRGWPLPFFHLTRVEGFPLNEDHKCRGPEGQG